MRLAILGAESTGKTELSRALAARWGALTGAPAQPAPPAPGMLPGQTLLPPYRDPLR